MSKHTLIGKVSNGSSTGEEGFTLLEYVAGAAVIIGIVFASFTSMGVGINTFFTNIGTWAVSQSPTASSNN